LFIPQNLSKLSKVFTYKINTFFEFQTRGRNETYIKAQMIFYDLFIVQQGEC
jgi:hypothetical protein